MNKEDDILSCWKETIKGIKSDLSLGFCLSHLEILITVYLNDGITRQDLMANIGCVSSTTLKRYVKDMVNDYDYITETLSDNDTRVKQLHISGKGKRLVDLLVEKSKECFLT